MTRFLGVAREKLDLAILITFCAIVVLDGLALGFVVRENSLRAKEVAIVAATVLESHCGQRTYAQSQVEHTSDLLASTSREVFYGGITRSQMFDQLKSQRAYRDTFKGLDCRAYSGTGPP